MSRWLLLVAAAAGLLAPCEAAEPGTQVQFLSLPRFNQRTDPRWGPVLTDIVNHEAPGDNNPFDGLVTKAHETTHGINSYIRIHMRGEVVAFVALPAMSFAVSSDVDPELLPQLRRVRAGAGAVRLNGFYVLEDRAVQIAEPNCRKRDIIPYLPPCLRGPRYQLYVVGQTAWDDTPLYIWDEWTSYVNGALTGVDLVERGMWTYSWQDAVFGPVEFTAYAFATAMSVKAKDPQYFASNLQFREYLAFNARRAMDSYRRGYQTAAFKYDKQEEFLNNLRTHPDAAPMRDFVRQLYGAGWAQSVMGF